MSGCQKSAGVESGDAAKWAVDSCHQSQWHAVECGRETHGQSCLLVSGWGSFTGQRRWSRIQSEVQSLVERKGRQAVPGSCSFMSVVLRPLQVGPSLTGTRGESGVGSVWSVPLEIMTHERECSALIMMSDERACEIGDAMHGRKSLEQDLQRDPDLEKLNKAMEEARG